MDTMNVFIHCVLISGFIVIINGNEYFIYMLKKFVNEHFENGGSNLTDLTGSSEHKLTLVEGKELGRSAHSLVWKGIYNDEQDVAVKICWDKQKMLKEMTIYKALNAVDDPKIEDHKVPRVYYYGKFLEKFYAIALSLFDGTLADYCKKPHERHLSGVDLLYVFLQTVKGLEYLSTKNVVHNDIKPLNLFYRNEDVFIGDFDLSTVNGEQNQGHTTSFASANFFANKSRHAKDDLESLVYSLWLVAGVPIDEIENEESSFPPYIYMPVGKALFENLEKGKKNARSMLMKKCKHFPNKYVREMFEDIIETEILASHNAVPNYGGIIEMLIQTINSINENERAPQSDWLSDGLCSIFRLCEK